MYSAAIRKAAAADVAAIVEVRNDAHAMKVAHSDYVWGEAGDGFSERWVRNDIASNDVRVVESEGTMIAVFSITFNDDHWGFQEPNAVYVHGLSVRKGFNGRGLGRFILDWCAAAASDVSRQFVRLDCAVSNAKLCAYYESIGFDRIGLTDDGLWSLYQKAA